MYDTKKEKEMKVFVKSAGFNEEQDYHWKPSKPSFDLDSCVPLIDQDSKSPSLLCARVVDSTSNSSELKLVLWIQSIASSRKDFRNRTIYNHIVWITPDTPEMDQSIRSAMIEFLLHFEDISQSTLYNQLDELIYADQTEGFKLKNAELINLLGKFTLESINNTPSHLQKTYLALSPTNIKACIDILQTTKLSPSPSSKELSSQVLFVVTSNKPKEVFDKYNVLYGLSKLIKDDSESTDTPPKDIDKNEKMNEGIRALVIVIVIFVCIIIALFYLFSYEICGSSTDSTNQDPSNINKESSYFKEDDDYQK